MKTFFIYEDWKRQDHLPEDYYAAKSIESLDRDKNLGLFKRGNDVYTSGYNGLCYLMKSNMVYDYNSIIKVKSRFSVDVDEMISTIVGDDEFEAYLFESDKKDSDSLEDSELIKFYDRQPLIKTEDPFVSSASILFSIQFILAVKILCMKPLYRTMEKQESNFTGKVKGKILIGKNIKCNTSRGRNERIYCQYGTSNVDNLPNRIIKAALKKL